MKARELKLCQEILYGGLRFTVQGLAMVKGNMFAGIEITARDGRAEIRWTAEPNEEIDVP